jgi:hypothetical protein
VKVSLPPIRAGIREQGEVLYTVSAVLHSCIADTSVPLCGHGRILEPATLTFVCPNRGCIATPHYS